jgi:hypothetical protein
MHWLTERMVESLGKWTAVTKEERCQWGEGKTGYEDKRNCPGGRRVSDGSFGNYRGVKILLSISSKFKISFVGVRAGTFVLL